MLASVFGMNVSTAPSSIGVSEPNITRSTPKKVIACWRSNGSTPTLRCPRRTA